jgi:hypothetical protein
MSATHADDLPLVISWFPTAKPDGPAIGDPEHMTWGAFTGVFWFRREGAKDGPNFVPARFALEPAGRKFVVRSYSNPNSVPQVRRLKKNLLARTAIAMDCEPNKKTGEVPPEFSDAVARINARGWAAVVYTSHSHATASPRYRIVLPLSEEIATDLPAPEVVADQLQLLGVLDHSKIGASSLFYLPSCASDQADHHDTLVIKGQPIDAIWMRECGGLLLAARQAEADRIAEEAHAEAAVHRAAKIAAGFDPNDSLIEKIRAHLDLDAILRAHGYATAGKKYRHPNSESGSYGADIKVLGGVERVFSHNGTDPLHTSNLPAWCDATALDAVDTTIILDFGGNRKRALTELAQRFRLNKQEERKKLAATIFGLIRQQATQAEIEAITLREGERLGLSRAEVIQVATWVANTAALREAA